MTTTQKKESVKKSFSKGSNKPFKEKKKFGKKASSDNSNITSCSASAALKEKCHFYRKFGQKKVECRRFKAS